MEELLDKALKGDNNAYGNLINEIYPELYYIAKSQLSNSEDLAEVMQETALKSFKYLHTLKDKKYFKTWIIRILLNECKNFYIAKNKQINVISKIIYFFDSNKTESFVDELEGDLHFNNMLSVLNKEEKIVIILHYKHGYTAEEISYILQKNLNTVRSQILRAREKIKKFVKEEEYNESGK